MCLKRSCVVARTAAATGVSVRSIHNICKECLSQDGELKRYAATRVRVNLLSVVWCLHFMHERSTPHAQLCWRKWKRSVHSLGEGTACGGSCGVWDSSTKEKMENNSFMRKVTYWYKDTPTYSKYWSTADKAKHLDETWVNPHHTNQYILGWQWWEGRMEGSKWEGHSTCRRCEGLGTRGWFSV